MRQSRVLLTGIIAACLVLATGSPLLADGKAKSARAKRGRSASKPSVPTGVPSAPDSPDAGYGVDKETIREDTNKLGQTVYTISASQFDISAPLSEMALNPPTVEEGEGEEELSNPQLPDWRVIRSDTPDPVVQSQIPPANYFESNDVPSLSVPSTGFNFPGVGISGGSPSDSNGSVGLTQYVETVNTRYQVWSLNRGTFVATSVLGPSSINTLWSGFGGACQTQNAGDPIVLYDKVADRWLISQFTSSASSGVYYQCVAVSTTASATGTYARWAFAVPSGRFGDYPHFGVWSDAYYMMAHAFTSSAGTYVAAIFAAMDRTKMLAGDPTATWQVILDATEGGHMPADLDGFAPPPTNAPGIFLSLHTGGMVVYRMKVDFVTPANTVKTLQATVPVAASTGACAASSGQCIPQPGTATTMQSLGDRMMFRAAYRNFIDHESLVISHSVDPSVTGLVSGVRWYDFRLSGTPDAVCTSYPCVYQQGTIADVANGRSRWMPSIAMDTAENVLVGYSVTGKTANSENHTMRYTGRAKGDPLGTMTAPETTVATGTKNNTNNRWGDYTSMSVDPSDDCTFWYVSQYIPLTSGNWATRIMSAVYPTGTGPGQCPVTTCTSRPASAPTIGTATVAGPNQVALTWTGIAPTPGAYAIERADGVCGSEGLYRPLGSAAGGASSFTDTTVQGGYTYSYRVIAATDAAAKCQALVASGCISVTATGTCTVKPTFAGAAGATSNDNATCGVNVSWSPATSSCPLTPNMRYSIFRGTNPGFVPSAANRIATCVPGPTSYLDTNNLTSGATYFYVVRAEDDSTGNGGECGGNEESNSIVVSGTAYGPGTSASPGTWVDAGGDGTAFLKLNVAGAGDTSQQAWRFISTATDAGANHTSGGTYAYRNAGPLATSIYSASVCAEMQTPSLTIGATTANLQYWERHQLEYHWDGIAVEYSVNGGAWTDVPAPSNLPLAGCAVTDSILNWETLSCTGIPPANACGYSTTKNAIDGPLGSGSSCIDWATSATVPAYVHRCHQITGLTAGSTIQFRWRFASDPGAEFAGFYLDDIAITSIRLPNTCTADACGGQPNGTACNDGNACTQSDSCQSGLCVGSNPVSCTALDACHLAGTCNPGTGVCSNPNANAGTACGDPTSSTCTAPDTCNGSGTCLANNAVDGTSCGDAGTACGYQDTCLTGVCQDNGFKTAGTACGSSTSNACTAPDSCDGAGACLANHSSDGTFCGDAGSACVNQDTCLSGACQDNGFKTAGTVCGDPATTTCTAPDSCDGSGSCQTNDASNGTLCGDAGSECVNQDTCQSGACQDNGFKAAGTGCGDGSSGACDAADTCDGSGACQVNHAGDGTLCGDAGTACTNQDVCLSGACQDNGFKTAGTTCGSSTSDACTAPDSCDGAGACLAHNSSDGTLCGDAGTQCTNQDTCLAGACHDNGFQPAATACGDPTSSSCTAPDTCNGSGSCQVNDVADGTHCGDVGTECANQDLCVAGACQDNGFQPAGTACGGVSPTACTDASTCDGAGVCQGNPKPDGTACGDPATECVNQDTCVNGTCSDNGFKAAGMACGDDSSSTCDAADSCDGAGVCRTNLAADGAFCGDAGSSCVNQDTCLSGMCQDNGFAAPGTACGDPASGACDAADGCNGAGGCLLNHVADGTSCDDADPTTCLDGCSAGACVGTPTPEPAEIGDSVRVAGDKSTISWTDPTGPYNVYRGANAAESWSYNQTCFSPQQAGSTVTDTDVPPSDTFFYYLISRVNECRESVIGRDSSATADPNTTPCPN